MRPLFRGFEVIPNAVVFLLSRVGGVSVIRFHPSIYNNPRLAVFRCYRLFLSSRSLLSPSGGDG